MALKFGKKKTATQAEEAPAVAHTTAAKAKPSPKPSASGLPSFMKKGAAAKAALAKEEAEAELRKEERNKMWRYWMPAEDSRAITFLDGDLDDGMLDVPMYHEHSVQVNGNWETFVCTADNDPTQPCPLCESGNRPSLVGVMTVIDHSEHKVKKGKDAGKVITNQRKLFVAKQGTLRMLTQMAIKRGGLAGATFDVSRTGSDEPNVGNVFDFTEKRSPAAIAKAYGLKPEEVVPADYPKEITYRSPEELLELGVGKAPSGVGYEKGVTDASLKDQL